MRTIHVPYPFPTHEPTWGVNGVNISSLSWRRCHAADPTTFDRWSTLVPPADGSWYIHSADQYELTKRWEPCRLKSMDTPCSTQNHTSDQGLMPVICKVPFVEQVAICGHSTLSYLLHRPDTGFHRLDSDSWSSVWASFSILLSHLSVPISNHAKVSLMSTLWTPSSVSFRFIPFLWIRGEGGGAVFPLVPPIQSDDTRDWDGRLKFELLLSPCRLQVSLRVPAYKPQREKKASICRHHTPISTTWVLDPNEVWVKTIITHD